ncbi:MAG TPA: hypothetical protein ENF38_00095 [Candidatus Aenigmarchaeota archaeon]|nr:hypothetical protein [Candidatus Aenigmarchaeota archaeon]
MATKFPPKVKIKRKVTKRYVLYAAVLTFVLTAFTSFFPPFLSTPYREMLGYTAALLMIVWNYATVLVNGAKQIKEKRQQLIQQKTSLPKLIRYNNSSYEGPKPYLTLGFEEKTGREIVWPNQKQCEHMIVVGSTGSGKSSFLFSLLYQQVMRGGGVAFIDGGRNPKTLKNLVYICESANALSRLRIVDPREPRTGHSYNPLSSGDADAIANKIMKVLNPIPTGSDAEYYKSKIYRATVTLVRALVSIGKPFNVKDVLCLFCLPEISFKLLEEQLSRYELLDELISLRTLIMESRSTKSFRDDLSNMIANLGSIAEGETGEALCSAGTQVNLYDAVKKNQVVYFMLPRMSDAEKATRLGRLLLGDIQTTIGLFYEEKEFEPLVPFLILLDELGSYANPEFAVVFEQARKAHFAVVAAVQSFANLANPFAGLSREFKQQVLGNTNTKVFLSVSDMEDAREMAALVGQDITYFKTYSTSVQESHGADTISAKRFLNPTITDRESVTESYSERYDFKIRPEVFMHELGKTKGKAIIDFKDGNPIFARTCWFYPSVPRNYAYEEKIPRFAPHEEEPLALWERVQAKLKHLEITFEDEKEQNLVNQKTACHIIASAQKHGSKTIYVAMLLEPKTSKILEKITGVINKRDDIIATYRAIEEAFVTAKHMHITQIDVFSPIKTVIGQLGTGNIANGSPEEPFFKKVKQQEKQFKKVSYHAATAEHHALTEKELTAAINQAQSKQQPKTQSAKKQKTKGKNSKTEQTNDNNTYNDLFEET